jgi:peptide-methionine (R)-S-oxide reductase
MNDTTRRGFIFGKLTLAAGAVFVGLERPSRPQGEGGGAAQSSAEAVTVVQFAADGTRIGPVKLPKVRKSQQEWKRVLTPRQFAVTRLAGTEEPYSGDLVEEHRAGIFRCADCDNALFDSETKFESGTGWSSFWQPIAAENVYECVDRSLGMERREVKCTLCDAHLGHVFPDGPPPTDLRYCMNSLAMCFVTKGT